ncbi:phosphoribosyl-dephospho-CoA transferase [Oxalobacteraceae bacterium GrIS 1.11]
MAAMFTRHKLVWLSAPGWLAARAAAAPEHAAALERWQREDWPLVVRRDDPDLAPDHVCLGLALAPDPVNGNKLRIGLRAHVEHVLRSAPALPIKAVLACAPPQWQAGLRALDAESVGLTLRAYGSLALQALTGQAYLGPASDIDLLFYPRSEQQLHAGLALLARHAQSLPLDGEIVFPNAQAVAWKEWQAAQAAHARVLVKERAGVRLLPVNALLATLMAA